MKIISPSATIISATTDLEQLIERAGRVCYKSEDRITDDSHKAFIKMLIDSKHESVLEHGAITVHFVVDRGVSHELVRHRIASFSQESTRYVSSVDIKGEKVETDQEVVDLYESGMSMRRIAELTKGRMTEWDVYKVLDANGIERRPGGNTGVIHHSFFDSVDTVEKAYLLGVIQADGSVRAGDSPQVSITQHEKHAWYLHRMVNEFIRPAAPANKDKKCRQITFTSSRIRDALISMGVIPNKSYDQTDDDVERLWRSVPSPLIPSFLRGFLDGDGGIRFFKQSNHSQTDSCNINWSGHLHLLELISGWLDGTFGYSAKVHHVSGTRSLNRLAVTNPAVGDSLTRLMLDGFRWPFGHPAKTARMVERVGGQYPFAEFGDSKFVVIHPGQWIEDSPTAKFIWLQAMDHSERAYSRLRMNGASPQEARSVLPNSLATEVVMTANPREWLHVFRLRCSPAAHPQMREVMIPLRAEFARRWPSIFGGGNV